MYGTIWVALGEGSTLDELDIAVSTHYPDRRIGVIGPALRHLRKLMLSKNAKAIAGRDTKTNLKLNGRPLEPYDLRRIEACEIK